MHPSSILHLRGDETCIHRHSEPCGHSTTGHDTGESDVPLHSRVVGGITAVLIAVQGAQTIDTPTVHHNAQLSDTLMPTQAPFLVLPRLSDSRATVDGCTVLAPRPCAWRDVACGDQREDILQDDRGSREELPRRLLRKDGEKLLLSCCRRLSRPSSCPHQCGRRRVEVQPEGEAGACDQGPRLAKAHTHTHTRTRGPQASQHSAQSC